MSCAVFSGRCPAAVTPHQSPQQQPITAPTSAAAAAGAPGRWRQQRRSPPAERRRRGSAVVAAAGAGPSDLFVLDFDGVLCDSEKEVRPGRCRCAAAGGAVLPLWGWRRRLSAAPSHAGSVCLCWLTFRSVWICCPRRNTPPTQVSTSALEACQQVWPGRFDGLGDAERARVLAGTRAARPRLVKGYEAMVMARLVLEDDRHVWAPQGC